MKNTYALPRLDRQIEDLCATADRLPDGPERSHVIAQLERYLIEHAIGLARLQNCN